MRSRRRRHGLVHLMPGVLAFAAGLFLILAAVPIHGSQPDGGAEIHGFGTLTTDHLQTVNEIRPLMAHADGASATPSPPPAVRQPVPQDALPVNRSQPVSGSIARPPTASRPQDNGPISIAVVSNLDGPLASQVAAVLGGRPGLTVFEAELATLERPDVVLILDASTAGASVWYCGPSPNESSVLASSVLAHVAALGQEQDEAIGSAVDASLSCPTLHAGRARMAAVDLRLPVADVPGEELVSIVTSGLNSYLDQAEARIRRERNNRDVTWPAFGPITSHYGPDHALGIDIGQWEGDVVAATDGVVMFAGGDACCSYGLYAIVESPGGITTLYGHLDSLYVEEGESVRAGQPLGPVGNTGHSSGTHLHFETLVDGTRVNPLSLLP